MTTGVGAGWSWSPCKDSVPSGDWGSQTTTISSFQSALRVTSLSSITSIVMGRCLNRYNIRSHCWYHRHHQPGETQELKQPSHTGDFSMKRIVSIVRLTITRAFLASWRAISCVFCRQGRESLINEIQRPRRQTWLGNAWVTIDFVDWRCFQWALPRTTSQSSLKTIPDDARYRRFPRSRLDISAVRRV